MDHKFFSLGYLVNFALIINKIFTSILNLSLGLNYSPIYTKGLLLFNSCLYVIEAHVCFCGVFIRTAMDEAGQNTQRKNDL